jgi:hypothetical protein
MLASCFYYVSSSRGSGHGEPGFLAAGFLRNGRHALTLRSTAAASATNVAASSMHMTWRVASRTSGRLLRASPCTAQLITNPPPAHPRTAAHCSASAPTPAAGASMSMKNSPPLSLLSCASDTSTQSSCRSGSRCSRRRTVSLLAAAGAAASRHASSRPQGCQLSDDPIVSARTMSHAPGLDRATRSHPGAGTNGVAMNAAATAEPDRSWITTFQPFLTSKSISSPPPELDRYCPPHGSVCDDLKPQNKSHIIKKMSTFFLTNSQWT